jgi:maltose/maltodextrin transport system substrate-binding protein
MKRIAILVLGLLLLAGLAATASVAGKLLIWADDTRAPIMIDVAKAFTEAYGVEVEVQEVGFDDIRGQLPTAGPAGEGPDILVGAHDWLGQLILDGLLEPVVLTPDQISKFDPVAIDAFSWGDQLYGVPYATENVALIYNKDLVPTVPATFAELLTTAKGLTDLDAGKYGFLIQEPDPYHTFPLFSAGGGYIFGKDANGVLNPCDIGLDNAGAIAGAQLLDQMVKDGIEIAGAGYSEVTGAFNAGNLAMMIGGPWTLADAKAAGINYGVAPIPPINGNDPAVFVGVQGFMISAYSQNKVLANLFIKDYLIQTDVMLALYIQGDRPPAYMPALSLLSGNADIQGFAASAANGIPMPKIAEMNSVWSAWSDALELIVNQTEDPATAMHDAADQIRALLNCP